MTAELIALFNRLGEEAVLDVARAALTSLSSRWNSGFHVQPREFFAVNRSIQELEMAAELYRQREAGE